MVDRMGLYGGLATGPGAQHFKNMDPRDPKTLPIPADPLVRISGGIKLVGGTLEMGVGLALAPKSGGASLVVTGHGFDVALAGASEVWNGAPTRTVTAQTVTAGTEWLGVDKDWAYWLGDSADIVVPGSASIAGMASKGSARVAAAAANGGRRVAFEAAAGPDIAVPGEPIPYGPLLPGQTAPRAIPPVIYRSGKPSPSNLKVRPGEAGVSFRDSLSNPIPKGERPVFPLGDDWFGIDTTKLPPGTVIPDNVPPGHVTVTDASVEALKEAVIDRGKFPK